MQSSVEAKRGVSGYRNTQDALENVSAMKSEFDTMKGRTLEDMSQMVEKLTKKIEMKKAALAPMLKELRPMRQQYQVSHHAVSPSDIFINSSFRFSLIVLSTCDCTNMH